MRKEFEDLKTERGGMAYGKEADKENERTLVMGGLKEFGTIEEVDAWVRNKLWRGWVADPLEVFKKGEFKGTAFARFDSKSNRDKAIRVLSGEKTENDSMCIKEDLAADLRARKRFLLGLRDLLKTWGFMNVRVDDDLQILELATKEILRIEIQNDKLVYNWTPEWRDWHELHGNADFMDIKLKPEEILQRKSKGQSKGK